MNINYLVNTNYKQELDSLLASYGLYSTVTFPTRICSSSSTAIDNIFINKCKNKSFNVLPWENGLSDNDVQIIIIYNVTYIMKQNQRYTRRVINESSLLDFQINLSYELWDDIFVDSDVDIMFNNFLNTYLRILNSCFRITKSQSTGANKSWITPGIIKSCNKKGSSTQKLRAIMILD